MRRRRFAIDVLALVLYLAAANPMLTGVPAHEWFGLVVVVVFAVHVAVNFDLIAGIVRRNKSTRNKSRMRLSKTRILSGDNDDRERLRHAESAWALPRIGNAILDTLIASALAVCVVSGLLISGDVLRVFGLYAPGYFVWDPLHAISAKVLLALLIVHVALHMRSFLRHMPRSRQEKNQKEDYFVK